MRRDWALSALRVSSPGSMTMAEWIFMGHKSLVHDMPPSRAASHEPQSRHNMALHILCDSCEQGDRLREEINGVFLFETLFSCSSHDEIYFIKITVTSNSHTSVKISNMLSCFMDPWSVSARLLRSYLADHCLKRLRVFQLACCRDLHTNFWTTFEPLLGKNAYEDLKSDMLTKAYNPSAQGAEVGGS